MNNNEHDEMLERNVGSLIGSGGEPPRISDIARTKIRAHLVDKLGVVEGRSKLRSPMMAVGIGLVATAAAALIITRFVGGESEVAKPTNTLADGSSWIVESGAKVEVLGERRVRVIGAALLDIAPGKGTFVVETARGNIEVLGTRFVVDANADRTTTAVVRGKVKLTTSDGNVTLFAGEQGVAEPGKPPSRGPAPRLTSLVNWAKAARKRDEKAVVPLRNGTLFAREPNRPSVPESPLPIAKLVVDVVVEDQVARVALDQTFHNPQNLTLEGMYRFAIPPDASLQRLAMYVDGNLTESAVVERMRARRIYEEIVYRRLDPALLEWAGTGRLALRVYPLPPREDKRLLLAYTQSLPKLYDDWTLSVPLPEVDLPVGELEFGVRVRGCANCEVTSPSHTVKVTREGEDAIVKYNNKNEKIGDSLVLHVRDGRKQATVGKQDDFFLVRARPDFGQVQRTHRQRTWVILDDVSASRGPLELKAQADLIDGFMRELDEEDRVAVVAFDVEARTKLAMTRVMDVDRTKLRTAIKDEGGVGATNFSAALTEASKLLAGVPVENAMIVYVGDGVITTGPKNLDALRTQIVGKAQFVGVGVGDGPDTQTLESLASATGGYATTIDLADDVGWRAFDLVAALHTPRVIDLSAKLVDQNGTLVPSTSYLKTPQLADGEELELVAKLSALSARPAFAVISGQLNGQAWEQRIALDQSSKSAGYLPRLWAQRHIAARLLAKHEAVVVPPCAATPVPTAIRGRRGVGPIVCASEAELREKRDEAIRQDVITLGKQYFLLSRHTSLLVLENDKMYAQYDVKKGSGDTWAPYKTPQKIEVKRSAPTITPTDVAEDAELTRAPLQVFYNYNLNFQQPVAGFDDGWGDLDGTEGLFASRRAADAARESGILGATRSSLNLRDSSAHAVATPRPDEAKSEKDGKVSFDRSMLNNPLAEESNKGPVPITTVEAQKAQDADVSERRGRISTGELLGNEAGGTGSGFGFGAGRWGGARARGSKGYGYNGLLYPQRFTYPSDIAYDDLTAFVPALFPDANDALREALKELGQKGSIDASSKTLLDNARRALPVGVLRWGSTEFALDGAHRIGWRRTTDADLVETASYDGTTLSRRYAELGLDVTRPVADDDIALALAYLPLWIADSAHYAKWFVVTTKSPREIALSRTVKGKSQLLYSLAFDDKHHLVAVRDAKGNDVIKITWGNNGPINATIDGETIDVGFTAQSIDNAVTWAHGANAAGISVEAAGHLPAFWTDRIAKLTAGTPEWRHANRQLMVSYAATSNRAALFQTFEALRKNGGVELGDLVLASGGIATGSTDVQFSAALAPLANTQVARYLIAGRAYGKNPTPERMKPESQNGMLGALWTLREATAFTQSGKDVRAVDRMLSLGERAFDLRLIGVAVVGQRYTLKAADITRAWDSVAKGEYRNIARAQAALALANRGNYDLAADRIAALVADLDLSAPPPQLQQMQWQFQNSRRGQAGWQLVWATWRDRALASSSFEHVLALMPLVPQHPVDAPAILARAAALADGDTGRVLMVAQLATNHGHPAIAQSLVDPIVKAKPTREILQLAGQMAQRQGRLADALTYLEQAQSAGEDEAVNLSTVRAELSQLIGVARQLAVQSSGTARSSAVQKAMSWATKWRAIDPGNNAIDQQVGELMLAVGDTKAAWRELSTVIERDPMEGTGYQIVADAFERQGRVAEAIEYWNQAVVIDQTNPQHRLRKAQALIALGRTAEGDALLAEIAGRKWHERWEFVAYQARDLLARGKRQQPQ